MHAPLTAILPNETRVTLLGGRGNEKYLPSLFPTSPPIVIAEGMMTLEVETPSIFALR